MINFTSFTALADFKMSDHDQAIIDGAKDDRLLFGWLPAYPMLIFIGIVLAVIACIIKFRLKRIPLADLRTSIIIIIPVGIVCASIFGKLGVSSTFNWRLWELLYIWNPGMNLFGGLAGGTAAGFAWFWRKHNQHSISMWVYADCIVPNVLLAQAIGRWGNLFNHEILGKLVTSMSQIQWLPHWIWSKLFYIMTPDTGQPVTELVYRHPLFLYESIATFVLFLVLSFVVPNLGRWFSKKPWTVNDPTAFPYIWNKNCRRIKMEEMVSWPLQAPIKMHTLKDNTVRMNLWNVWNKAYFWREVDYDASKVCQKAIDDYRANYEIYLEKRDAIKERYKVDKEKAQARFRGNKIKLYEQIAKYRAAKIAKLHELPTHNKIGYYWRKDSKALYNLHNDKNYFVVHCGMTTSMFLILYTIVRAGLESQRNIEELTVRWSWALDYFVYFVIFACGVTLLVFSQFIAPKKWREEGWLYEKSY